MLPFITGVEWGSFVVVVTPLLTVDFKSIDECTLASLEEIDFNRSPLKMFPYVSNIQGNNLLWVSEQKKEFFYLMDSHLLLTPIQSDPENSFYTKLLLRIPKNDKEGF